MPSDTAILSAPARHIPWLLFAVIAVLSFGVVVACLALWGQSTEGWLRAARYTARLSFLIFLAPFLASSFVYWLPSPTTRWLRAKRRYLGLSFALAHFVHLGALITYLQISGDGRTLITLLGGGGAYVMIALMALTSNDWSVRTLGPKAWGWLHWIGVWDIWFIFTFTYFGRFTKDQPQEPRIIYITLFALAVSAMIVRIGTRVARRK